MLKKILGLLVVYGIIFPMLAQNFDELLDQVDSKLRKDKKYLNINFIAFPNNKINEALQNIPRTNEREPVSFSQKDNISYNLIFLRNAVGIDSIQLLYVDEITDKSSAGGEKLFGETTGPAYDTIRILRFKDLWMLQKSRPETYMVLYNEVRKYFLDNPDQEPPTLLRLTPDTDIKTSMGISSRDNTDYLNFMRANSFHYYPKAKVIEKKGLRKSAAATADSSSGDFRIEVGYSGYSISHPAMDFSFGGASVELTVTERMLNLLPYQNGGIVGGFRTLLSISEKKEDITKAFTIDAKLLARIGYDLSKIATSIPVLAAQKARLHLNNAAGIDVSYTKVYGLPFLNFYIMAGGAADVTNSKLKQTIPDKTGKNHTFAYYNTTSAEGSMSFYWNTSESLYGRFRIDVGGGYYDVYSAEFASATASTPMIKKQVCSNFSPMIMIHFNFAPDGKDVYYASIRMFDSQIKMYAWLKLLEFDGGHVFRIAATLISAPIARVQHEWETSGGAFIELRYRYGF